MDFPQNLSDHMPEKSDPIAHNGKQNVLVYHIRQNLLKFPQGALYASPLLTINLLISLINKSQKCLFVGTRHSCFVFNWEVLTPAFVARFTSD